MLVYVAPNLDKFLEVQAAKPMSLEFFYKQIIY